MTPDPYLGHTIRLIFDCQGLNFQVKSDDSASLPVTGLVSCSEPFHLFAGTGLTPVIGLVNFSEPFHALAGTGLVPEVGLALGSSPFQAHSDASGSSEAKRDSGREYLEGSA